MWRKFSVMWEETPHFKVDHRVTVLQAHKVTENLNTFNTFRAYDAIFEFATCPFMLWYNYVSTEEAEHLDFQSCRIETQNSKYVTEHSPKG